MSESNEEVVDKIPHIDPVLQAKREARRNRINPEKLVPTFDELPPAGFEPEKSETAPVIKKAPQKKSTSSTYPGVDPEKMARDFDSKVRPRKDIDD